jgi:1-aminocyclopropane-1-carboxylate deaminase
MISDLDSFSLDSPVLQDVPDALPQDYGVRLRMLRLDTLHPQISGNKWYKLRLNLISAREQGYRRLLSFGGAYSNHLYALAAAGKVFGFETIGILRGELVTPLNSTLAFAQAQGMVLHSVSRSDYRLRNDPAFIKSLVDQLGDCYVIPEGGSNVLGMRGCMDIPTAFDWDQADVTKRLVTLACGTGATLTGIAAAPGSQYRLLGFSALKGGEFLKADVQYGLDAMNETAKRPWQIDLLAHGRGYGKTDAELDLFIQDFELRTGIPLDPIYTGKMMRRLYALISAGEIAPGTEIIAIHTGGLR